MNRKSIKLISIIFAIMTILAMTCSMLAVGAEEASDSTAGIEDLIASFAGKKVSIIGDSISTMAGVSNNTSYNTTIGSNASYYSSGQATKWWQQVIDTLGMELCVNNSWSGSMVLKNNKGDDTNNSAGYVTRCVNLHNDTDEVPVLPDIIFVYLGTNDFTHNKSAWGNAEDIDYASLIVEEGEGYTYATPTTVLEAYAIMLHKMQQAYPDAEIYCADLLPRRNPVLEGKANPGQPTEANAELRAVIAEMGAKLIDFENCGLSTEPEIYDIYITDQNVHPGNMGMDLMSVAVLNAMLGTDYYKPVSFAANCASRDNAVSYVTKGSAYETNVVLNDSYENLRVTVTIDGVDVTSSVYADGKVTIPSVDGNVLIRASGDIQYRSYLQELPESICEGTNIWTALKPTRKSFTNKFVWENGTGSTHSVTFAVNGGDQLWATSFGAAGTNGHSTTNGIRVTWFLSDETYLSLAPGDTYKEFTTNGYITAPENAVAANIVMWNGLSTNELYILNREHDYQPGTTEGGYEAYICTICGDEGEKIVDIPFDGAVAMEGFSIRLESYNGLRGIFSFDWNKNTYFESTGYELVEFGAIAIPRAAYEAAEGVITFDAKTGKLVNLNGQVVPVWKNGAQAGRILGTKDNVTQYALSIIEYEDNYSTDVYFCAYSVYNATGEEEPIVTFAGYQKEDKKFVNLYQLTLDMYVNGAINSSNTDDEAVWNTLLTGVVTLTSSQYGTGAKDMNGNAFGDSFTFKDVSNMASGTTVNDKIKITLFHDYKTDKYVAIWRGTGSIPDCGSSTRSQFYYGTSRTQMSNPKLTEATSKKITTFVYDYGITGAAAYTMSYLYVDTYVCSETFTYIGQNAMRGGYALTNVYQAKATGYMQQIDEGLADFSFITNFNAHNNLFQMASSTLSIGVKKIHFPSKLYNKYIGAGTVSCGNNVRYKNLTKIWCGDTPEPADGVIDLTGITSLTYIHGSCFAAMSASLDSYICILPDGCRLTNNSNNAFYKLNVTEIRQATYNPDVVTDISNHLYDLASKTKYCNLKGQEWSKLFNILFIGNSFTYYNDMPTAIFPVLAETAGYGVNVTAITNGGHTLAEFADSSDTYGAKVASAFANNSYDIVILQEQSHRPISNAESFYSGVRALYEMATQNGAKTYLYATWGYDADHKSLSTYGTDTADMEMKLRAAYEYIGDELNIPVCHVGAAMTYAFTNSSVSLYKSDNYHPLISASTLAAMTILSEIYDVDPADFDFAVDGVSADDMAALKTAASYVHNNDMSVPDSYKTSSNNTAT